MIPGLHLCWITFARPPTMRSGITWVQEMGDNTIIWWGCPLWDCMIHPWYSPMFCIILHQEVSSRFLLFHLPECFCILFEICLGGAFTVSIIVALYPTIIEGDAVKVPSGFRFSYYASPSSYPVLPRWVNISWFLTPWHWDWLLEVYLGW